MYIPLTKPEYRLMAEQTHPAPKKADVYEQLEKILIEQMAKLPPNANATLRDHLNAAIEMSHALANQ